MELITAYMVQVSALLQSCSYGELGGLLVERDILMVGEMTRDMKWGLTNYLQGDYLWQT